MDSWIATWKTETNLTLKEKKSNINWHTEMPWLPSHDQCNARATVFRCRVARWDIFRPKIALRINFGGHCNGRCYVVYFMDIWSILQPFDIFYEHLIYMVYGHLVYFVAIWYIFPVLVHCTQKNGNRAQVTKWTCQATSMRSIHHDLTPFQRPRRTRLRWTFLLNEAQP
jgi:hypothetical protein